MHELYIICDHVGEKIFCEILCNSGNLTFWVFCIVKLWISVSQLVPVTWLGHQDHWMTATRIQEYVFAWVVWQGETVDSAKLATSTCSQAWAVRCKIYQYVFQSISLWTKLHTFYTIFFCSIGVTATPLAPLLQHVIQSRDNACVDQV